MLTTEQLINKTKDLIEYLKDVKPDIYRDILNYDAYHNHFSSMAEDDFYSIFYAVLMDADISYEEHLDKIAEKVVTLLVDVDFPLTAEDIVNALKLHGVIDADELGEMLRTQIWPVVKHTRGGQFSFLYEIDKNYFNAKLVHSMREKDWEEARSIIDVLHKFNKVTWWR